MQEESTALEEESSGKCSSQSFRIDYVNTLMLTWKKPQNYKTLSKKCVPDLALPRRALGIVLIFSPITPLNSPTRQEKKKNFPLSSGKNFFFFEYFCL